jgi:arginine/lysine/ornithine decarboxylase
MPELFDELQKLADSDVYPFHMPGHKRNLESTPLKGAFRFDITEIDGFDNLHDEQGLILEAERRAGSLYGADTTYFLVNGSTSGVLAAVSAAVPENGLVLAARGSHKSFYHAVYLRQLRLLYLPVKMILKYGIFDGYSTEDVRKELDEAPERPAAVFLTSPTYEGKCSDIRAIADVCHEAGIPLVVDAAHGAHFGFGDSSRIPESAVSQGADIVIHSVHKTLGSMTQTALLHVQGNLIDRDKLKRFLRIYQSSSPSYVLMASIDLCMKEMEDHGFARMEKLLKYRDKLDSGIANCKNIRVLAADKCTDPGKVLIYDASGTMTGQQIYDILREEFMLQLEMAGEKGALAIITGWDTEEGIDRLTEAVINIDRRIFDMISESGNGATSAKPQTLFPGKENVEAIELPRAVMMLHEAWDAGMEVVPLEEAAGRISGDFVNLYPPGIPLIVPGEEITSQFISDIERYMSIKLNVQGVLDIGNKGIIDKRGILCVKQK